MACVLITTGLARGQADLERFQRQLEQIDRETRLRIEPSVPLDQRTLLDYGAYTTLSFVTIDDLDQKTHILRQYDLNAYARLNIDGVHDFFVRARTTYRDFNTGDDFDGNGDDWVEPTLDRATYRFDLQRHLAAYEGRRANDNLVFQGGRQLVNWANGLVLSQEIDGVLMSLSYSTLQLDLLAGVTRDSIVDFDSSRPEFDNNTQRGFYGALLGWQVTPQHRPFIYGLLQRDYNTADQLDGLIPTTFNYDSYYIGVGANGSLSDHWLYGIEAVYEGGRGLSNSFDQSLLREFGLILPTEQTTERIEAFALNARLEYAPQDYHRSRFGGEVILASGDDDRLSTSSTLGGNQSGTVDRAFNGFGFLNTGLAFNPSLSNLILTRVGASTYPWPSTTLFKRFQVGSDFFVFNKFDHDAPIDELTRNDSYLGAEIDLFANWQITSDVSVGVRYGVFFPGEAIVADHDARHFFYSGVTLSF